VKKVVATLLAAAVVAAIFSAMHSPKDALVPEDPAHPSQIDESSGEIDFDFTRMNQTVLAAYIYRLAAHPPEFEGKLLRFAGSFVTAVDEEDGKRHFGCRVEDGGGGCPCCSQAIILEFEPNDSALWQTNFPPEESSITVTGKLKMVRETNYGQTYDVPHLVNSDVLVNR